jgi:hypothetical protein
MDQILIAAPGFDRAWNPSKPGGPTVPMSLCESCGRMREIISGKGSRFLLCELSRADDRFVKYPRQPVLGCLGYLEKQPPVEP